MKENLNSHNGSQRKVELYFQNAKRKQENHIKKKKKSECSVPSETSKKFPKKEHQKEEKLSQNEDLKCQKEYYTAIKKNTFESVLMRWMKLEPTIQSEVSQKEKHQYSILTRIYMEFRKMVTITLYVRQQKRHRCIEQSFELCGRGRGWDDLGEWH